VPRSTDTPLKCSVTLYWLVLYTTPDRLTKSVGTTCAPRTQTHVTMSAAGTRARTRQLRAPGVQRGRQRIASQRTPKPMHATTGPFPRRVANAEQVYERVALPLRSTGTCRSPAPAPAPWCVRPMGSQACPTAARRKGQIHTQLRQGTKAGHTKTTALQGAHQRTQWYTPQPHVGHSQRAREAGGMVKGGGGRLQRRPNTSTHIHTVAEGEGVDGVGDVEGLQREGHEVVDVDVGVLKALARGEVDVARHARHLRRAINQTHTRQRRVRTTECASRVRVSASTSACVQVSGEYDPVRAAYVSVNARTPLHHAGTNKHA
jgi:hypothetical protein